MLIAHKIELNLNNKQRTYMAKACGVARFAYNWALADKQTASERSELCRSLSFFINGNVNTRHGSSTMRLRSRIKWHCADSSMPLRERIIRGCSRSQSVRPNWPLCSLASPLKTSSQAARGIPFSEKRAYMTAFQYRTTNLPSRVSVSECLI